MKHRFSDRISSFLRPIILGVALAGLVAFVPSAPLLAQHASGHSGGKGGGGHSAGGGHEGGGHEDGGGEEDHGKGKGKKATGAPYRGGGAGTGRGAGVENKVLRSGRATTPEGGSGGRPAWAGGTVPEDLELGRLNVARAPGEVLQRALDETYATNLDKNADGILDPDADFTIIDSPRANLALYREAISGQRKVAGAWTLDQAAGFLGKAADKNIAINTDTVAALDLILEARSDFSAYSYDRAISHPTNMGPVFGDADYSGTGIDAFAQAADDARAIALYKHDNR